MTTSSKHFGAVDGAALVVASVVGAGIFTVPALVATVAGSGALAVTLWTAGGLIAMAGALCYAELAARHPRGGAEYVYLREAFGDTIGFLSGWTSFVAGFSGAIAVAAVGCANYLGGPAPTATALGLITVCTAISVAGVQMSRLVMNLLTVLILVGIVVLAAVGLLRPAVPAAPAGTPTLAALGALVPIFFTYSGWNAAAYVAGEFREPSRDVPRALIGGTLVVTLLYVGLNAATLRVLPLPELSTASAPIATAARLLLGSGGAFVVSALAVTALASSVCALVITGPRIYSEMAADGALPRLFAAGAGGPARVSIIAQSAWSAMLVLTGSFEQIVTFTGFGIVLFSGAAVAALLVLRHRHGPPRGFAVPWYPVLPLAFIGCTLVIAVASFRYAPVPSLLGIALIGAGVPLRRFAARARAVDARADKPTRHAHQKKERTVPAAVRATLSILLATALVGIPAPAALGAQGPSANATGRPIEIRDAIEMVRIEDDYGFNERFVTFSPDGSKFAVVVSRGDLERDVIQFSLLVFDAAVSGPTPRTAPVEILSIPFDGDSADQRATPITEPTFLADNRTIAFLGTLRGEPRQVYAVDIVSREVRALTAHPTAVRAYTVSDAGRVTFFAAVAPDPADSARVDRIRRDGLSAYDGEVVSDVEPLMAALNVVLGTPRREVRQYFMPSADAAGTPRLIFDSRMSRRTSPSRWDIERDTATQGMPRGNLGSESELSFVATYSADPAGRYALMWPYIRSEHSIDTLLHDAWNGMNLYARGIAAYYGLVNLADGSIEPLLDQLYVPFLSNNNQQWWAPDGRSVLIRSLVPLGASGSADRKARRSEPPAWLEVQVPSREFVRVPVPDGWSPLRWDRGSGELILRRADSLVAMRKVDGTWQSARPLGVIAGFNPRRPVVTDGRIVVGVVDSLDAPPELAAHDLRTGRTAVLTDLNPQLRGRRYGVMERIRFSTRFDSASSALLVKPVDFQPGTRYPLVVLHANHRERPDDRSFLIDGRLNLSGHAAQPLAAQGFMVLFIGTPPSSRPEESNETETMRANIEGAVRAVVERGYVDSLRVGVSGWSRSAYYTENLLMLSSFPFAAASQLDGGSREYAERNRPYTDAELARIRAPMLVQAHGQLALIYAGGFADRLRAQGLPVEFLYFATASHSTRQPRHRMRSLATHVDWWRYWLQDYEDPDPAKAAQYRRWRHSTGAGGRR